MIVKRFIVGGVPRSGSTFVMNQLAIAVGAHVPAVNQHELFNVYEKLFNCHVLQLDGSSEIGMLEQFFQRSPKVYAGFKTIPGFHREWEAITGRTDIQFITLIREDFLSCLASYIVSDRCFLWERPSREQLGGQPLVFQDLYPTEAKLTSSLGATLDYLLYNYRAVEALNQRPATICLSTESLNAASATTRIRDFFGQSVSFEGFQRPTHYTECFADHFYFKVTVIRLLRAFLQFDTRIPAAVQTLL